MVGTKYIIASLACFGGENGRSNNSRLVAQFRRDDGGPRFDEVQKLLVLLADATANDDQLR